MRGRPARPPGIGGLRGSEALAEVGPVVARVAAVAAVLIVTIVAAILVTRPYGNYEVVGVFDDTRGLIEGGDVTAGFQEVGTVQEITLGDDGLPRVRMQIDGEFKLHQGAFADIRLSSNVGAINRVVDLKQGDPDAPELEDGDTLGPSSTDQPVDLDAAVSTLDPGTRKDAARVLAGLDAATVGRGDDLDATLRHSARALNETANLLGQVNTDGAALTSLVTDTGTMVGALAESPGDLGAAAERTATLLRVAGGRQAELRRSIQALGPALSSGGDALESLDAAIPELRGLVVEGRPLLKRLGPVARRLPALVKQARPTLRSARRLVRRGPKQFARITPLITEAIPLTRELEPMARQINPLLDYLRAYAPETVGFFQLSADAIANYDANGHLIRFTPAADPDTEAPQHHRSRGQHRGDARVSVQPLPRGPRGRAVGGLRRQPL